MSQSTIIGLYHPLLMNRVGISLVLNTALSNRVKHVDHLYDLFSVSYSFVVLIEPEILSLEYNPHVLVTFLEHIRKPVIIVPFDDNRRRINQDHVMYTKSNPRSEELIECIEKTETRFSLTYKKAI